MTTPQLPLGLRFAPDQSLQTYRAAPAALLETLAALAESGGRGVREEDATPAAVAPVVFLSGPSGSGKSHLLLAACAAADAARTAAARGSAVYLPLRLFGARAAEALAQSGHLALACIDDVEAIAGDRSAEVALFDLHNRVRDRGGAVVYAADAPVRELPLLLPDLRSRLAQGAQFALAVPDEACRRAILVDRAATRGLELDESVVDYLFRRVGRDLATLTALLDRLDHASLAAQRRITVPFLKDVAGDG